MQGLEACQKGYDPAFPARSRHVHYVFAEIRPKDGVPQRPDAARPIVHTLISALQREPLDSIDFERDRSTGQTTEVGENHKSLLGIDL